MNKDFEALSHILENIECDIIEQKQINPNFINNWSPSALRSATKIFFDVVGVEMWQMCEKNKVPIDMRCELFEEFGNAMNSLILAATDKNSREFYNTTIVTKDGFITTNKDL